MEVSVHIMDGVCPTSRCSVQGGGSGGLVELRV